MLPATVLLYRKLGIILMMVKCVSCGFASFFFSLSAVSLDQRRTVGRSSGLVHTYRGMLELGSLVGEKAGRPRPGPVGEVPGSCSEHAVELQPLARRGVPALTPVQPPAKLSHRPSVLSEDLQLHDGPYCSPAPARPASPRELFLDHQAVFSQCPALQTSSPYKQADPALKPGPCRAPQGRRLSWCRPH